MKCKHVGLASDAIYGRKVFSLHIIGLQRVQDTCQLSDLSASVPRTRQKIV